MDFINKMTGGNQGNNAQGQAANPQQQTQQSSSFMDKLHGMAGGGPESEKKEDTLDKGTTDSRDRLYSFPLCNPHPIPLLTHYVIPLAISPHTTQTGRSFM